MKNITHNKRHYSISAAQERALRIIAKNGVVAYSDLTEGKGKHVHYACDIERLPGVKVVSATVVRSVGGYPSKINKFMEKRPSVRMIVYDNHGAAKHIVAKLEDD